MRTRKIAAFVLVASIIAGCTMDKSAIWLLSASSPADVVFGVATERNGSKPVASLDYVAVKTCYVATEEQTTVWQARARVSDGTTPPTRIRYGEPPRGFSTEVGPTPLSAGCYEALISGDGISGTARFKVEGGSVHEAK